MVCWTLNVQGKLRNSQKLELIQPPWAHCRLTNIKIVFSAGDIPTTFTATTGQTGSDVTPTEFTMTTTPEVCALWCSSALCSSSSAVKPNRIKDTDHSVLFSLFFSYVRFIPSFCFPIFIFIYLQMWLTSVQQQGNDLHVHIANTVRLFIIFIGVLALLLTAAFSQCTCTRAHTRPHYVRKTHTNAHSYETIFVSTNMFKNIYVLMKDNKYNNLKR